VLVAPAMNPRMWAHPATQANAATVRERGVELIGPGEGETAEGELGVGRMAEPEEIFERVQELLGARNGVLSGKRVLVTAGGTREPLDAVRFVGNRSSGRMGVALAEEAQRRGADVTLIASNLAVPAPDGIEVVEAPTAAEVERATASHSESDVVLMAAAVSDYRPSQTDEAKRPKDEETWQIELEPTSDVLKSLGERRANGQVLVGFAAETAENGLERARKKLADKQVDLIVYNDVSRDDVGFDAEDNEVVIVSAQGERVVEKAPKEAIAAAILDEVERLI
jgi:phosphopantothenoylcysteine decarboxylase/phosphopantothenate--cysteine ligase